MPTTIPVLRFSSTRCLMSASTAESDGKPGSFARAACCACAASVVERDEANSDTRLPIRSSRDEDMTRSGLTRRCVGAKHTWAHGMGNHSTFSARCRYIEAKEHLCRYITQDVGP